MEAEADESEEESKDSEEESEESEEESEDSQEQSEEEESDDENEGMVNLTIDPNIKKAMKAALGKAAVDSDAESSEEEVRSASVFLKYLNVWPRPWP